MYSALFYRENLVTSVWVLNLEVTNRRDKMEYPRLFRLDFRSGSDSAD